MARNNSPLLASVGLASVLILTTRAQQSVRVDEAPSTVTKATTQTTAREIDPAKFDDLFASIKPATSELRWLEIPRLGTLREGRQTAATAKKPMFLWAMNGHPLGTC